ncbi:MAG TPA: hypothetical protein VGX70_07310 [Gemmataceae bacterium]|nr:hypothetical protein [Gemmataceae bacterium]
MPRPGSNGGTFQVHCSGLLAERFKQIQKQAKEEGRGEEVLSATRRVLHQLSYDPVEFGEPLYRLPALQLSVRHAAIGPVVIHFAVHERMPLVFIKGVTLLPQKAP